MHAACQVAIGASAVFGIGFVAAQIADSRRQALQRRLGAIAAAARGDQPENEARLSMLRPTKADRRWHAALLPAAALARLEAGLAAAGSRIGTVHLVAVGSVVAVVVGSFLLFFMQVGVVLSLALTGAAGLGVPMLLLREMQRSFRRRFLDLFPEALDLIVRAVKSGLPVLDAMAVAAREIPAPVGTELQRTLDEMHIGVELEDSFQHTAERLRIPDFQFFVVSLVLQRRTGGALAEILSNLSTLIRRRKEIRVKTRALSAEARASAVVLSSLPIIVFVSLFFIRHDLMQTLVVDPRGRLVFGLAISFLLTGILVMAGLVRRSMR